MADDHGLADLRVAETAAADALRAAQKDYAAVHGPYKKWLGTENGKKAEDPDYVIDLAEDVKRNQPVIAARKVCNELRVAFRKCCCACAEANVKRAQDHDASTKTELARVEAILAEE